MFLPMNRLAQKPIGWFPVLTIGLGGLVAITDDSDAAGNPPCGPYTFCICCVYSLLPGWVNLFSFQACPLTIRGDIASSTGWFSVKPKCWCGW